MGAQTLVIGPPSSLELKVMRTLRFAWIAAMNSLFIAILRGGEKIHNVKSMTKVELSWASDCCLPCYFFQASVIQTKSKPKRVMLSSSLLASGPSVYVRQSFRLTATEDMGLGFY